MNPWLKVFSVLSVLASSPFLSGCKNTAVELSIFHSNDTHMSFRSPKSDEWGLGGMAKLTTLAKTLKPTRERAILVDAGDWSEGNWYYNLDLGATALRIFDAMGMDAAVVGNHDYLNGPDAVWMTPRRANTRTTVLAANFDLREYDRKAEFEATIRPYTILERNGVKIGIIGLSTVDYVYKFWLEPVRVSEPIEAAQNVARELRPKVDVLLVLSHNSFSVNQQVARSVAGVDAVISGHSHQKVGRAVLITNAGRQVPVVETGSWGRFLGELKLSVDAKNKIVQFVDYQLHPVSADLADDPTAAAIIDDADSRLNALAGRDVREVVATSDVHLGHEDARTVGMGDLTAKAYRAATGADLAVEILSLTGVSIAPGPVTVKDLHDVMPHIWSEKLQREWTLKVWNMRGQDLQLFVQLIYLTNLIPLSETGFFAFDGLEVTWSPKGTDSAVPQVRAIRIQGQPLDPLKRYDVAVTDGFVLALREVDKKANLGIDFSRITETGLEGSQSIIQYGERIGHLTEEALRVGGRSYTTVADPAISRNSFRYLPSDRTLRVAVHNDGLMDLVGAKLQCRTGLTENPIAYDTPEQVWEPLPEASIPTLHALESVEVLIPWSAPPGRTPVACEIVAADDGYAGNSRADAVLSGN